MESATFELTFVAQKLKRMNETNLPTEVLQELERKVIQIQEDQMFPTPKFYSSSKGNCIVRSYGHHKTKGFCEIQRPKDEHIHDFIFHALFWRLGVDWYKNESQKPLEQQHIILRWAQARNDFFEKTKELGLKTKDLIVPPGEVRELLSLASDLHYLHLSDSLPKDIIKRLKNQEGFQGVRYEIAVATSLIRGGFTIKWTNSHNTNKKIHEFDAFQSYTNETIAIEAKSKRRTGTFHYGGNLPDFNEIKKLDIFPLLNDAKKQNPNNKPFGIFIDINLPRPASMVNSRLTWKDLYLDKYNKEGDSILGDNPPAFLAITNSAWHYDKENLAQNTEYLWTISEPSKVKFPLNEVVTFHSIERALKRFSHILEDDLSW